MQSILRHRGLTAASTLLLAGQLLSACSDAGALGSIPASQLFGATSLNAAERKEYIRSLKWRLSALVKLNGSKPLPPDADTIIDELCECVVDNLQDRTTRLQFSMAIDTIKSGGFDAVTDFSSYRSVARAKGMDAAEFDQQAKETGRHIKAAGRNCMSRFARRR